MSGFGTRSGSIRGCSVERFMILTKDFWEMAVRVPFSISNSTMFLTELNLAEEYALVSEEMDTFEKPVSAVDRFEAFKHSIKIGNGAGYLDESREIVQF
jgi:hypothetical protein